MGFIDNLILLISINFIAVIIIFWIITFIGSFFYKQVEFKNRNDFYECGFLSTSDNNFSLNCGVFITMIFVLVYDVELLFLIPIFLNSIHLPAYHLMWIILTYIFIILSFYVDIFSDYIKWDLR